MVGRQSARWTAIVTLTAICLAACGGLWAEEPAAKFMAELRRAGYLEQALLYLERAQQSPLISDDFRQTIALERGLTLIQLSRTQRDPRLRTTRLDEAKTAFDDFLKAQPAHPRILEARTELGNVLVERANILLAVAERANQPKPVAEVSQLLDEARAAYQVSLDQLRSQLKAMTIDETDGEALSERARLRTIFVQTRLLSAAVLEMKITQTLDKKAPERAKLLQEAATEYGEIYSAYRKLIGGLYARLYQGRCMQELGKHKEAIELFQDLLDQDDSDDLRPLKNLAQAMTLDSLVQQKNFSDAAAQGEKWLARARPQESRSPEGLKIHFLASEAMLQVAAAMENPRGPQATKLRKDARRLAVHVASMPGDYRDQARQLLASFGAANDAEAEAPLPTVFAESLEQAKETFDSMRTMQLMVETLPEQIKEATDPQNQSSLQEELKKAEEGVVSRQERALKLFQNCLNLVDNETTNDDINTARYYLCYLNFSQQNYYEAALLGQFVALRYPSNAGARVCAKIAMASYYTLWQQLRETEDADPKNLAFLAEQTRGVASYLADTWPGTTEADEALNLLIPLLVNSGKLAEARAALEKIPADSPKRGSADLATGQAIWSAYLAGMKKLRKENEGSDVEETAELVELKNAALETLKAGVQRMRADGPSKALTVAAVSLAQLQVDAGDSAAALQTLEDPEIGPLTLVSKNDPATQHPGLATETYKTALRAYLESLGENPGNLEKASQLMQQLKKTLEGPELLRLYYGLAKDLQAQLEIAPTAQRKALTDGFRLFLKQVTAEAKDFALLAWVGQSLTDLGVSLGENQQRSETAREIYTDAIAAYDKILDQAGQNPEFLPSPNHGIAIRQRVAENKRRLGLYTEAVDEYEGLLKEKNTLLPLQIAAAETLQEWAMNHDNDAAASELFNKAIVGDRLDRSTRPPRYVIWGWSGLANRTSKRDDLREQFHQARVQLATCRFEQAGKQSDPTARKNGYLKAKRDIQLTNQLFPDLGGDVWRGKYDELLKRIQRQLDEPVIGLAEFRQATSP